MFEVKKTYLHMFEVFWRTVTLTYFKEMFEKKDLTSSTQSNREEKNVPQNSAIEKIWFRFFFSFNKRKKN